ncbi:NAD(P)H-dependent flavin oxidoreductase [Zavarzinia compransoris]|uniref:Nitronate monooxygenase n=1 Tax=Zavarzinia compransoris TaxID=1264899 RepID=A0A317E6G7_9PROT|nr:nitronate monooxygenase family protein [Zavarzinia compransoris]PWR21816.1 2-nitropropane dioxygenase [Zavarzinia compransoris]TDP45384.1 nitronate monooxygenase [Zavarzinia compransoris]
MTPWPDQRLLDLFAIDLPVIQAPMAGATTPAMVIAVSAAGGLGSLPSAQYAPAELRAALDEIRAATARPINVNFFCHQAPRPDAAAEARWRARLAPFYAEAGLVPPPGPAGAARAPFDDGFAAVVEEYRPEVVSFHFGLPADDLLARVRRTGARIVSSATTVAEARALAARGVDAVIAMGAEAGGHRGSFLDPDMATQAGTMALVPQVADAVGVPVIAAGGIADGRGVAAAFMLGAAGVQVGTAYLFTPEAKLPPLHRAALARAGDDNTALTNLFTGRPARGVVNRLMRELGPLSADAPAFPTAGAALAPLRQAAEAAGRDDFTNLWSGQAAALARATTSAELTRALAAGALDCLRRSRGGSRAML